MQPDTDKQYEPEEDPDTDAATTPDEVEGREDRDQAEGEGKNPAGSHAGDG